MWHCYVTVIILKNGEKYAGLLAILVPSKSGTMLYCTDSRVITQVDLPSYFGVLVTYFTPVLEPWFN